MVIVGGICMKRLRIVVADSETLADAPLVNN
jgi:phosphotransferase system IIB component